MKDDTISGPKYLAALETGYAAKASRCRPVRVIKRQDREKSAADYQRDHEIALLKLLAKKHPDIAADLATTTPK